jgi:phosphoglycerol transferase MdoB-like AlkP superfamily enzyme
MMKKLKIPRYIVWIIQTGIIFLLLMSFLRWLLVIIFKTNISKTISLKAAYWLGMRFDLRVVAIMMLILFIVGSIPFLHPINKKWGRRVAMGIWTFFIVAWCIFYAVDFGNYAYLQQRVNASVLNFLQDAKISFGMMWQSYHLGWNGLALIGAILLLIWVVKLSYNFILSKPNYATKKSSLLWGVAFVIIISYAIVGRIVVKGGQFPLRWSDAFSLGSDYAANVALNPFQSFFSTLSFREATYSKEKVQEHYAWMSEYLGVTEKDSINLNFKRTILPNASDSTSKKIQNVVLVICESFSSYKSSMHGNPLSTTPFFASMCKEGIYFNRAFSPAYGTARGVWATITGVPDVQQGKTSSRNPSAVDQHTIINDFTNKEKFYFLGGSSSWANIRGLLTNNIQGLNLYEQGSYKAKEIDVWGISDKNLFLEANEVLAKQTKPFFAVIQTADNHRPFTIPEEDMGEFKKLNVPKDTLKKYGFESVEEYNAFRFTDFCYQKFIEAAKKEKYFDNTLFVFIGDHGIRGDAGNMLPNVYTSQGLTNMHVPLLFYAPKILQPKLYDIPASQVDVLPSIAHLCNIGYVNTTLGRNLFNSAVQNTNHTFIFDEMAKLVGVLNKDYFYNYQLKNNKVENFLNMNENSVVQNDSATKAMRFITDAFYETSRYLLLTNKKSK